MRLKRLTALLMAGTCFAVGTAHAQDAAVTPADPAPVADEASNLEIIVTAQRRSERLSEVPIAITAISGESLSEAGISGTLGLTMVTPGLNFSVQGAYVQPTIRGIGTSITGAGADANVAIYIDGVYQPSQAANAFQFNNVERIEVLKGPQGTLFGRNATGGAITITTKAPSHDFSGNFSAGYGSYDEIKLNGYLTGGLTDTLAADLAVIYSDDKGYTRNITTGNRLSEATNVAARGKLLFEPTDNLSFTLIGNYSNNKDNSTYITKPIDGNNTYFRQFPGLSAPDDIHLTNTDTDPIAEAESWGVSLNGRLNLGNGALSSISSYQNTDVFLRIDSDVTSMPISTNSTSLPQKTFTQEVNYASDFDSNINFIAGVFYYNDKAGRTSVTTRGVGGVTTQAFTVNVDTEAAAGYGEVTFDVTDQLHLVGGIRYSTEKKHAFGTYFAGPVGSLDVRKSFDGWTPRAAIRYEIDNSNNVYGSYSRGFKSGIFNTTALNDPNPVNPENVDAFEVGYKHSSHNISLNTSAFYYKYKDIQVGIQTNVGGVSQGVIQNAASAEIYGLDADLGATLSENWNVRAGLAYTHGRYEDFRNALVTTPIPGGGNVQAPGDASGKELIRTPEFTANLTLGYKTPLAGGEFNASATGSYNSGFFWDPGNRVKQDDYALFNAQLSWLDPSERYKLTLWGNNLSNTKYYYYASVSSSGDSASYQRPRTVGFAVSTYFK